MKDAKFIVDVTALRMLMYDRNITTISELARVSGVNRNTLSDVFNGKTQPSSKVMYKLVDCLQIPPAIAGRIFLTTATRWREIERRQTYV